MAHIVGPSQTVVRAPSAFRRGSARVLTFDSDNDSHLKARSKSSLLFPVHFHRMLSLPSSQILGGH